MSKTNKDAKHEAAEEIRLFYVALTRARDRLVVVAGPSRGGSRWIGTLRPWGFDADNPPADGESLCDGQVLHRIMRPATVRSEVQTIDDVSADDKAVLASAGAEFKKIREQYVKQRTEKVLERREQLVARMTS